mgnify:CR=1 FL=1
MKRFEGKVAIITGASRGIGRAIAEELAKGGANVVVNYSGNEEKANEVVQFVKDTYGVEAMSYRADVSNAEEVDAMVKATKETFGAIDFLVNNAGITRDMLLMRLKEEDWDDVLRINLKGAFLTTKAVTRTMMRQRAGRIVNIASVVGVMGNAGQANYAAAKAGLIGLTKSAARELASRNIQVNAVAPGFIETDMTDVLTDEQKEAMLQVIPMQQLGQPEDVAKAVAFLLSEDARYITGQTLHIDGGMVM